eukprot:m.115941 g.115941  ORF g.115941 m.115941 type:complete len:245 (+) comp15509_c0_seq2:673-1407(+)
MLQAKYRRYGFEEVMTPLVFKAQLWQESGHWDFYQDDMILLNSTSDSAQGEDGSTDQPEQRGLKPMNCPAHCVMFASDARSYRDLPLRLADFTALHRNEASGALTGLTRVSQFHQDDGHVFCTNEQVEDEISACLQLVDEVYTKLGLVPKAVLSTRPDKFVGDAADWDVAEAKLEASLAASKMAFDINPGDGAFYGPKIDIRVLDALGRLHQTATIQVGDHIYRHAYCRTHSHILLSSIAMGVL